MILTSIYKIHVNRIGFVRSSLGVLCMILCIPALIFVFFTGSLWTYQAIINLTNTKQLSWRKYIIIDRHKIYDMHAIDKFNCVFCGYANGICTLMNAQIDQLASNGSFRSRKITVRLVLFYQQFLYFVTRVSYIIIYELLVAQIFRYYKPSKAEVIGELVESNYAKSAGKHQKSVIAYKGVWAQFSKALEQIESQWCPLKHRERGIFPEHHKRFYNELGAAKEHLEKTGTVLKK